MLASIGFSEPESVGFFVDNEDGNPVVEAKVFVYNDEIGSWTAGVTDGQGNVVFDSVRSADRVWVFKAGMALANRSAWPQRFLREPHFVTLTPLSIEDLAESFRGQESDIHKVQLLTVDPLLLSIPSGGAAQATAVFQAYGLNATVPLTLSTEPRTPILPITLKPDPATIEVPLEGLTFLPLTFTVGPSLEPGIYQLVVHAEIMEFIQPDYEALSSGGGQVYGDAGHITLVVEVIPPGP